MNDHMHQDGQPENRILDLGSAIAGGVGGSLVGGLVAGPLGAVLGGVAGPILTEATQRLLSRREQVRIGALYRFTAEKAQANLDDGKIVRQDGFLGPTKDGDRADVEEIVEAVVPAAQREHEEKKIKYYANLLANLAFETAIDKADANLLTRVASRLSYRQLCLLAIFADPSTRGGLRAEHYTAVAHAVPRRVVSILHDVYELDRDGLINSGSVVFGLTNVVPAKTKTEGTGEILVRLMELDGIPKDDLTPVESLLA